jgi:uncharacterized protein (DUF2336 family)
LVRRLAGHDDIAVARPVLRQSRQLNERDLAEIAQSSSQAHLLALSKRKGISGAVTDILAERGERDVLHSLAQNADAQISPLGFAALIERAAQDDALAEKIVVRPDLPPRLLRGLVLKTAQTVRQRLLAAATPEVQSEIRRVLCEAGMLEAAPRDYGAAERTIQELHECAALDEARIIHFADLRQYGELVAGLAVLCEVPVTVIERLIVSDRCDPILILCKAAGWGWATARAIMAAVPEGRTRSSTELDDAFANFERLSPTTAQRVMRFWQVQHWQHAPVHEADA